MKLSFFHVPGLILCILLLLPTDSVAQKDHLLIKSECNSWRGNVIADDTEALCFSCKGVIQKVYIDSVHSILYALVRDSKRGKLRKTGNLVAYDFKQDRELWSAPFDFRGDQFFLADTLPVKSGKYYTECLDRNSGANVWRAESIQTELVTNRGIGFGKNNQFLVGLDLRTGKEIWRKHASFVDMEILEIHGDTAAMFLSGGLNYVNLNTGEGFKIKANTLEKSRVLAGGGGAVVAGVLLGGIIGGVVAGVAVSFINTSPGSATQRSDNSLTDMYMHEEGMLFTSKKAFLNVDYNGEIIWSVPVEKAIGPIRKVFVVDDAAYMLSKGMINTENGPSYSDAVLYRMNLDGTGTILGVQLNIGKREYVQDFIVKDTTIVVALNNKLVEIRLDNLGTIQEQSFGRANQNAGFGAILNPPAILFTDSIFEMAAEKHPNDFFVANKGGMKIRFSEELVPVEVIRQPNYFALNQKLSGQRMLVTNGTDVYLIDAAGKKLSDISFSPQMQYTGGLVFDYVDNRILGIKL